MRRAFGSGDGGSKDLEQAYMWFELAAAQGDEKRQNGNPLQNGSVDAKRGFLC